MTEKDIKLARANGTLNQIRKQEIRKLVRQRYDPEDEIAILRQKDTKPEEYAAWYAYTEECKATVDRALGL